MVYLTKSSIISINNFETLFFKIPKKEGLLFDEEGNIPGNGTMKIVKDDVLILEDISLEPTQVKK